FYIAQPRGKPPVEFPLRSWDGAQAGFVNPGTSDHLRRIVYRRNADGSLTARIEGANDGRQFAQDYHHPRAPAAPGHGAARSRGTGSRRSAMTTVVTAAAIERPPAVVFDFVTTPAHWLEWHPSSLGLDGATDHSLQVGEAVTEAFRVAGRKGSVTWRVVE